MYFKEQVQGSGCKVQNKKLGILIFAVCCLNLVPLTLNLPLSLA